MIAVCGTTSTMQDDVVDAHMRIFRPGLPGFSSSFDYRPEINNKHEFKETPQDCSFIDDDIVVIVGKIYGKHDYNKDLLFDRR